MYPNQSPPTQWNSAATPTSQSQQGWSQRPPNGQFVPNQNQIPPIQQAVSQGPAMQTLQPGPEQYRALPPPQHMYPPQGYGQPPMGYAPQQPAPRQRTAIACRYCRRRKIRCSGFDQSEDGRCTNCQRFSQECIFTPVSAQTQAFVPAHTVWRGQNPPQGAQLYGAYGQPLPQHGGRDQFPPPGQPGQYPPPPQGYQQPPMYGQPPQQVQTPQPGQKRGTDEPHTPTLPPPNPGVEAQMGYGYPNPAGASPFPFAVQPSYYYLDPYAPVHGSPQSAYSYDGSRASSSPQKFAQPGTPAAPPSNPSISLPGGDVHRQGFKINELVSAEEQQAVAAAASQALGRQEERTFHDTNPTGDGLAAAAGRISTKTHGVDIGVQTEESMVTRKEQDS